MGENTSIQSEINSPSSRLFLTFSHSSASPVCFSFLSVITMWTAVNVITKGWEGCVCVSVCVCVCAWRGYDCYPCTTKRNIKKLLSEKGTFCQIYDGGQLAPYVCGDGDNKSGSNYQSSSGEPVKTLGWARSDCRCHGDKPTSQQACVYQDIKNTRSYFYLTLTKMV